jgi:vancomycin resistance protein VanJ
VLFAAGLTVRLTIRDRRLGFDTLYYATPVSVLAALAGFAGVWWLVQRRWKLAVAPLLASLICSIWWYQVTWFHTPQPPPGDGVRVVFWNVANGGTGWPEIMRTIRAYDPDVIAVDEGGDRHWDFAHFWSEQWPGYQIATDDLGVVLLVRGELTVGSRRLLWGDKERAFLWCIHGEVAVRGRRFHVLVVDLTTYPYLSRRAAFEPLSEFVESLAGEPLLIVGDFNTPSDSVFCNALRRHCSNAFELFGDGYAATWPVPLPVLTLDQAWVGGGLLVDRCEIGWSWASDHRPLALELSVAP